MLSFRPRLRSRGKQVGLATLGFGLVLYLGAALTLVMDGLRDRVGPADLAVVLGNKVELNGQPSARLQARLDRAVTLYEQGWFKQVMVSGGVGSEGFDEAEVMKEYLVQQGIPKDQIHSDNQGINTYATAQNAAQLMQDQGYQTSLIISQYFHLPRTRLAFHRSGITTVYSAHAIYFEGRDLYSISREVIAFPVYWMKSY